MLTYTVYRYFANHPDKEVVRKGLTLEEAKQHCNDPETSSRTATSPLAKEYTAQHGPWFDGFTVENDAEAEVEVEEEEDC